MLQQIERSHVWNGQKQQCSCSSCYHSDKGKLYGNTRERTNVGEMQHRVYAGKDSDWVRKDQRDHNCARSSRTTERRSKVKSMWLSDKLSRKGVERRMKCIQIILHLLDVNRLHL